MKHYYEWGNEPTGMVSTGFYNSKEAWISTGYILKSKAMSLGLTYNCPYN